MATLSSLRAVTDLYMSYYGRPADPRGLNFWATKLDQANGSLNGILDAFANSDESRALFGNKGAVEQIRFIYQSLFNRQLPDGDEGLVFYTGRLAQGAALQNLALDILNGAQGIDLTALNNKRSYASLFTERLDLDPEIAVYSGNSVAGVVRAQLAKITSNTANATVENNKVDDFILSLLGITRPDEVLPNEPSPSPAPAPAPAVETPAPVVDIPSPVGQPAIGLTITDNKPGAVSLNDGNNGAITYTFTFSEVVSGFATGAIQVVNGTKGELVPTTGDTAGRVYTMVVTPNAGLTGNVILSVVTGAALSATGNTNLNTQASPQIVDLITPSAPTIDVVDASDSGFSNTDNISNVKTPTVKVSLAGTGATAAAVGDVVKLLSGATQVGSFTLTAAEITAGFVNIAASDLGADGTRSLTATITDVAGNTSTASTAISYVLDTAAPAAPSITGFSDNSGLTTDNITNDNTVTLTITAEAGSKVEVFSGTTSLGFATESSTAGTFSFTTAALADNSYSFTAKATDTAGNASAASAAQTVVVDQTAPAAPSITAFADNSGLTTDNITNDNTVTLTITAEAGSKVEVFSGTTSLGFATESSTAGTFSFTTAALDDNSYSFTAKATDTAGNASAASAAQTVVIDKTAPSAPSIDVIDASDSGSSNTDNLSNVKTPTVKVSLAGTGATAAAVGDVVKLLSGATQVGSFTLTAAEITAGFVNIAASDLGADGTKSLTATVTDVAGNASIASTAISYVLDTTKPATPTLALGTDSGSKTDDGITNANTVNVTGLEADAQWEFSLDNGANYTTGTGSSFQLADNTSYAAGTIKVRQTDKAGNVSEVGSNAIAFLEDSTAPSAPTIDVIDASDTGSSNTDNISNVKTPTVKVSLVGTGATAAAVGDVVKLLSGATQVGSFTLTAAEITAGFVNIAASDLGADGTKSLTATVTDVAGNASTASTAISYVLDTAAPTAPSITAFADNSGLTTDNITNDNTVTLTITAEAGSKVEVFSGTTSLGFATESSTAGTFSFTTAALADNSYSFTAKATDTAGNASAASAAQTVVIDKTAPSAPSIDVIDASDSGSSNTDNISNVKTPTVKVSLAGTGATAAVVGDVVKLLSGATQAGSFTLTAAEITAGFVNIAASDLGADGTKSLTATITDVAGNTSTASTAISYVLDTAAPAAPSITGFSDNSGLTTDNITNDNTVTLTITAEAGSKVEVFSGLTSVGFATESSTAGTFSFTTAALADNSYSFAAKATDTAGNVSLISAVQTVIVDKTAPSAPTIDVIDSSDNGASNTDNISSIKTPTVKVTLPTTGSKAVTGDVVKLLSGTTEVGSFTLTATQITAGFVEITASDLGIDGTKTLTATITDVAGNLGAASEAINYVLTTARTSTLTASTATSFTVTNSEAASINFGGSTSSTTLNVTVSEQASAFNNDLIATFANAATQEVKNSAGDSIRLYVGTSAGDTVAVPAMRAGLIYGFGGADNITGGALADTIYGGSGADTIVGGSGADVIDGGADVDTVDYSTAATIEGFALAFGNSGITLTLNTSTNATVTGGFTNVGSDIVSNVENVIGTNARDSLTGDSAANLLSGGFGIDTLSGASGNDTIIGGVSADIIDGGADSDTVDYSTAKKSDLISALAVGDDGISLTLNTSASATVTVGATDVGADTITNIENIIGTNGKDSLTGDSSANNLSGGSGDDTLTGGVGNDTISGDSGNDRIVFANASGADAAGSISRVATLGIDRILAFNPAEDVLNFSEAVFGNLNNASGAGALDQAQLGLVASRTTDLGGSNVQLDGTGSINNNSNNGTFIIVGSNNAGQTVELFFIAAGNNVSNNQTDTISELLALSTPGAVKIADIVLVGQGLANADFVGIA